MFKLNKTQKDENFPVASWLIQPSIRKHINAFYLCVRSADDIADSIELEPREKECILKKIDAALTGDQKTDKRLQYAIQHRKNAEETGVSIEYARHLVQAFTMDITKLRYRNWSELINYCRFSAAPVGRYLLELHGCNTDSRNSTDALCIALQILNHLQDAKVDYLSLNRVYIPEEIFKKHNAKIEDLGRNSTHKNLREVLDSVLNRVDELILIASNAPREIAHLGLRLETAIIISIAKKLTIKLKHQDPISERVELTKFQYFSCCVKGVIYGILKR